MLQTALIDRVSFDPFALEQNGFTTPEVHIGGREIAEAFVVAAVVVVFDESASGCTSDIGKPA